ncbi:MAG: aldehyde dehydrogenase family protein [Methanobacteriota archaeon]|nr:MAG: aldehyde dehydrogenase family protein [Euryarchaeota archaeon]
MEIKEIFDKMSYGPAPESPNEAYSWLERYNRSFDLFINGKWVPSKGGEKFETISPGSGEVLATITQGTADDVDIAVKAAKKAFSKWSGLSGHERAKFLYAIARKIQKHSRLFAVLETLDNGKPIRETRDIDIPLVARHFYYHAGWAQMMETELKDYEPIGVVGQIIPWNFPLLMLAWKIAPALAMGNTVVLKPAEFTSLTALLFAQICQEIGLPAGVVNIVTGDGRTGAAIVEHPEIKKIAFTGSTEVGRIIRKTTAGTGKKISLELGGKSPFIVFEDADLDSAIEGLIDGIWFNQGQVCCAGSRLLVQESIADQFIRKLKERMSKLRVGDPLDKSTDIGAIVAPVQLQRIQYYVDLGKSEGKFWQPAIELPENNGCYFPPTLFTDVPTSAVIAQEEIFGPVLVSMTFRTPQEAVELANNTVYGLAATVWTEDVNLALHVAPQIKAGTVWINSTNLFDAASGFGGYRESGYGREGGLEGLWEYVVPKWKRSKKRQKTTQNIEPVVEPITSSIDRTPKLYIGGRHVRPDGGYSLPVYAYNGDLAGEVGKGNRKDIRNAVEAADRAKGWATKTAHNRAQVLYYLAENLESRRNEFVNRIIQLTGVSKEVASAEFNKSIERLFYYAAFADKYDGLVHHTPYRNVTMAMPEPIGIIGISCPEKYPLLGLVSLVAPAIAMGNTVVCIPSETYPLIATDFYQVLDTSDVPGGVVNIVTGHVKELMDVLSKHLNVDAIWHFANPSLNGMVEVNSIGNLKRTFVDHGFIRDWMSDQEGQGREFLREATQIKNIWTPYGV